ncbi:MAG: MucR family transcriptional regulator [Robiginitomaculum sp.]
MRDNQDVLELVADVVCAYVGNNQVETDALPELIRSVYRAMLEELTGETGINAPKPVPAIAIEDSILNDYLICLEDGQKYKSLKRHLRTKYAMTPKMYREKWGLPADYPMVAPSYSIERSRLAKRTGLGKS